MTRWFASLLFGSLSLGVSCWLGTEIGLEWKVWVPAGLVLWWSAGLFFNDTDSFANDVSEPTEPAPRTEQTKAVLTSPGDDQSLQSAVVELTKQLRSKEALVENLQNRLTEREFRRSLSRLATIHETLAFTLNLVSQGKVPHSDALEQMRQEIESAISDLGLEHHVIQVGATISTLPLGSFVVLRTESAGEPGLAGTVKEVVSTGLCAQDQDGKLHFISPSKIHAYKL
jgi:hypothetical protein